MIQPLGFWGNVGGGIVPPPENKLAIAGRNLSVAAYNTGVPIPDQVQMVKDLGGSCYRTVLRTSTTGTIPQEDHNILFSTELDQNRNGLVPQLLAAGIPTLCLIYDRLYNCPVPYCDPPTPPSPLYSGTTQEAYDAGYLSCYQLVLDYGHYFTHFELSNEIDLFRHLKPGFLGMQASDYIEINGNPTPPIVAAYIAGMNDAVKDAKPDAITMFNFTGFYPTYLMDQVLNRIAISTHPMDLISVHVYNEQPGVLAQNGIPDIIADLWGRWGKKMWITECGRRWNNEISNEANEQNQVNWFNGSWVTNAFASPHVEKIFWFELLNRTTGGNGDEQNYGLYSFYDYDTNGYSNPQPKLLAQQLIAAHAAV